MPAGKQKPTIERGPGRPEGGYDFANRRYPGTTTVTGRFKDTKGLMGWQWGQGLKEGQLRERVKWQGKVRRIFGPDDRRDKAGNLGGHSHDAIEKDIHGEDGERHIKDLGLSAVDRAKCMNSFEAFRAWRKAVELEIVATEIVMRSEQYRFGGTLDAVARIRGKLALLDWKTSKRIYVNHIIQMGAYAALWMETRNEAFEEAHICRFPKDGGGFEPHYIDRPTLSLGAEQFLLLRKAYDLDFRLRKRLEVVRKGLSS